MEEGHGKDMLFTSWQSESRESQEGKIAPFKDLTLGAYFFQLGPLTNGPSSYKLINIFATQLPLNSTTDWEPMIQPLSLWGYFIPKL